MNIEKVIYKDGETGIQSTVYMDKEGIERIAYTGYLRGLPNDLTLHEYLIEGNGMICLPFDEALKRISEAEEGIYIKPWTEITEEVYMEALECLPPEKWQTVNEVNLFRMSEYTTGIITAHYARFDGRYFTANRRTSDAYQKMSEEVKALAAVTHA